MIHEPLLLQIIRLLDVIGTTDHDDTGLKSIYLVLEFIPNSLQDVIHGIQVNDHANREFLGAANSFTY